MKKVIEYSPITFCLLKFYQDFDKKSWITQCGCKYSEIKGGRLHFNHISIV